MADDDEIEVKAEKGGNLKRNLLITLLLLLGMGAAAAAWLYFGQQGIEIVKEDIKKEVKHEPVPLYYTFDPAFVVNFTDNDHIRYLQVNIEIMTYEDSVLEVVDKYQPLIRNNLIMLLSNLTFNDITTASGKRKIREEALAEIQNIVKEKTGNNGVEDLYFTNFVMQ